MGDLGATYFRDQEIDVVTLTATPLPKHPDRVPRMRRGSARWPLGRR
jgi:hypothetical protein